MTQRKEMARGIKRKGLLLKAKALMLVAFLLVSCDGTVYHRFVQVDSTGWAADDTLSFCYEGSALASASEMEVALQVRYGADYRYQNLYLRLETFGADSSLLSVDTLCCRMFDDDGRRLGSTAGTLYQNGSDRRPLAALCTDSLLLKVTHAMGENPLQGILDVGVILVESNR